MVAVRRVYSSAQKVRLMYATAQKPSRLRAILRSVKLRAEKIVAIVTIVRNTGVRTDQGSVHRIDGFPDPMKRGRK